MVIEIEDLIITIEEVIMEEDEEVEETEEGDLKLVEDQLLIGEALTNYGINKKLQKKRLISDSNLEKVHLDFLARK